MHPEELANIIRTRRKDLGITQEQMVELSGVGSRTIKEIEVSGGNPRLETINNLIEVLGLEMKLILKTNEF